MALTQHRGCFALSGWLMSPLWLGSLASVGNVRRLISLSCALLGWEEVAEEVEEEEEEGEEELEKEATGYIFLRIHQESLISPLQPAMSFIHIRWTRSNQRSRSP